MSACDNCAQLEVTNFRYFGFSASQLLHLRRLSILKVLDMRGLGAEILTDVTLKSITKKLGANMEELLICNSIHVTDVGPINLASDCPIEFVQVEHFPLPTEHCWSQGIPQHLH